MAILDTSNVNGKNHYLLQLVGVTQFYVLFVFLLFKMFYHLIFLLLA